MSPSAYLRNGIQGTFYTLNYLKFLENHGVRVINGYKAFTYETSKALQLLLLEQLGIKYPISRNLSEDRNWRQYAKFAEWNP